MARDAMTPLQRLSAYAKGEPIDRLPCVPIVGNTAARVVGARVGDFRGNGRLIAEAQIAAYRLFGYDIIRIFTDLYTQAEAMGAEVHYPTDETAYLAAPAIRDITEIGRLRPADPYRDGNLPHHLEAMKIAVDTVGHGSGGHWRGHLPVHQRLVPRGGRAPGAADAEGARLSPPAL